MNSECIWEKKERRKKKKKTFIYRKYTNTGLEKGAQKRYVVKAVKSKEYYSKFNTEAYSCKYCTSKTK